MSDSKITDHTDLHFRGQQETEIVQFVFRKHWIVLLPHTVIFLALFASINYFFYLILTDRYALSPSTTRTLLFFGILVATYYSQSFFNKFLNYYLEIVIMTNYRIIDLKKTLFLNDNKDTIDLHEIQEIQKTQSGLFKKIFNYGEITILISGLPSRKCIDFVPKPDKYFRRIINEKRAYILNRRSQKPLQKFPQNTVIEPELSPAETLPNN